MAKSRLIINRKKQFIVTYASNFNNNLNDNIVKDFLAEFAKAKGKCWYVIAREDPDDEIRREHWHIYFDFEEELNVGVKTLDIPLKKPVISFYNEDNYCVGYIFQEDVFNKEFPDDECKLKMEELGAINYKTINVAHPNVKSKRNYGSLWDMLNYTTKNGNIIFKSGNLEEKLAEYKELKDKKVVRNKEKEPEWEKWYREGKSLKDVLFILKRDYLKLYMKNYYKWSAAIYSVYGRCKESFVIVRNNTYWIPRKVYDWCLNTLPPYIENQNNKEWLINHRMDRPGTLIWKGPSQIGKTTFIRSLCDANYYQFRFDGMDDFEEDYPLVIIDDFSKEIPKYFVDWKCWLGCQTDFVINPKYGRRRRIDWGHPCVFLTNYDTRTVFTTDNGFTSDDLEYIKKNCTIAWSSTRNLWEKPTEFTQIKEDLIEVNIGEFRKLLGSDPIVIDDEPESERTCDESDNESIVIINEDGRPKRQIQTSLLSTRTRNKKTKISYITD